MAAVQCVAVLVITLVFGSSYASANFTVPILSPLLGEEACKTNVCGKGSCVSSSSNTFGFECQCDKGWKQARSENDQFFSFMPCVIPNCTINFGCDNTPDPAQNLKGSNFSVFDPCHWSDCGGGSCNKTSVFTHSCACQEGYYNLFNSTSFPCYKECAIGGDCAALGMSIMNSSNPSHPPSPGVAFDSTGNTSSLFHSLLITLVATLGLILWKYD